MTVDTAELATAQRASVAVNVRHDDGRRRVDRLAAAAPRRQAERLQEDAAELLSHRAVENEVDGTVNVDEQVAHVRQDDVPCCCPRQSGLTYITARLSLHLLTTFHGSESFCVLASTCLTMVVAVCLLLKCRRHVSRDVSSQ